MTTIDDGTIRKFETGATRDTAEGKLEYDGFLHPLFLEQFAKYMQMHRLQSDGTLRASDNWQAGIPTGVCMKSLFRHFMTVWKEHRNVLTEDGIMAGLMGMVFNIQMMVINHIKEFGMQDFDGNEPTTEIRTRQNKIAQNKKPECSDCTCGCCGPSDTKTTYEEWVATRSTCNLEREKDRLHRLNDDNDDDDIDPDFKLCPECGAASHEDHQVWCKIGIREYAKSQLSF